MPIGPISSDSMQTIRLIPFFHQGKYFKCSDFLGLRDPYQHNPTKGPVFFCFNGPTGQSKERKRMDIFRILETDGISLTRITGNEWAGPCPFCGTGRDRLRVWPQHATGGKGSGGRWWCRRCGKNGDAIQYLRDRRGLSFKEACEMIGRTGDRRGTGRRADGRRKGWRPNESVRPSDQWIMKAQAFQQEAARRLWACDTPGRAFLHGRGFRDETIKAAGLGWTRADVYEDRTAWGLEAVAQPDGVLKKLWLPAGLVIPAFDRNEVVRLRIRRPTGAPRYVIIPGSSMTPLIAGEETGAVVVVEAELDALLLNQETENMCLIVALGSVAKRPDTELHARLRRASLILNALDFDEAGAKETQNFWARTYKAKMKRWPVPTGKDPSEAFQKGIDLKAWIGAGLEK